MRIAVCVKQVPDAEARLRVNKEGTWLDEEDMPFVINESDECALEAALQIIEKSGGEVVAFSLGAPRVKEALRKALAMGASRAVPMRRLGQPTDVAAAVAFLASEEAGFITGQTLSVSGGLTMA